MLGPAVELGRNVAAATPDRQRQLELAAIRQMGELQLGVQQLEIGGRLEIAGRDGARPLLRKPYLDLGRVAVNATDQVLQVEDDVGYVLAYTRDGRELVCDSLDFHRGDGGAL